MNAVVVVPTIRANRIQTFLDAWKSEFADTRIIVVEDSPKRTVDLTHHSNVTHYSWEDIDQELGGVSWIIPRGTDCVRSYGYYKAFQEAPDMIVTIDDDCYPTENVARGFLQEHWERLSTPSECEAWQEIGSGIVTRGVPYFNRQRRRPVAINHGLWEQMPDVDAPTQLLQSRSTHEFVPESQTIPVGKYFPMSAMNLGFRPLMVPALYSLLMGPDSEYDRLGDIWSGIIVKKICDHLGYGITSGEPFVIHKRASDVWANLRKEVPGLELNETFWEAVDRVVLTTSSVTAAYREISEKLSVEGAYWDNLRHAMALWSDLFADPV